MQPGEDADYRKASNHNAVQPSAIEAFDQYALAVIKGHKADLESRLLITEFIIIIACMYALESTMQARSTISLMVNMINRTMTGEIN